LRRYKNAATIGHQGVLPVFFNPFRLKTFAGGFERLENIINKTNIAGLFWNSVFSAIKVNQGFFE
jgi:hypothetical protein